MTRQVPKLSKPTRNRFPLRLCCVPSLPPSLPPSFPLSLPLSLPPSSRSRSRSMYVFMYVWYVRVCQVRASVRVYMGE